MQGAEFILSCFAVLPDAFCEQQTICNIFCLLCSGSFRLWLYPLPAREKSRRGHRFKTVACMELRYHDDGASLATSWVFKVASCALPHFGEALDYAKTNGHSIGLHMESRSIIVRFADNETKAEAQSKMRVIFSKGGAPDVKFESVEALDYFHGESWGLIAMNGPPPMPELFDKVIFEDELSDEEPELPAAPLPAAAIPETLSQQMVPSQPDIFAIVAPISRKTVAVPGLTKAMTIESSREREVRNVLEASGGPLTPWLKDSVFPADKYHCLDVQAEYAALARKKPTDPINWLGPAPRILDLYFKPNMTLERRVAWIQFKAVKLKILLTFPVFMGFFKQVTDYKDAPNRRKKFKEAVCIWQEGFKWKSLDLETRTLVQNINADKLDCYCKNCRQVLPVSGGETSGFCSKSCSLQYCKCGLKFQTRKVIDHEEWTNQLGRQGHYRSLIELVQMLALKDEIDTKYQTMSHINVVFAKQDDLGRDEGCCTGFGGYFPLKCTRCKAMYTHLVDVQHALDKIVTGKVTWGHCEAAKQILENFKTRPIPEMDQKFCETCEPRKKARTL